MSEYNGWTNYATWRVNLEMFDRATPYDAMANWNPKEHDALDLRDALREWAVDAIEQSSERGRAREYAIAFLREVDWDKIARHILENYPKEEEEEG